MNIVNKLTLRQLQMNKKRTLVTIIGTLISTAMITAVATLGLSFMNIMQREIMESSGEWHVKYYGVNYSQLKKIEDNQEVSTVIISRETGFSMLKGSKNRNKPYLYIKEFNTAGFDKFPIKIVSGRLPEHPDEIVLSEAVAANAKVNYKLGDSIACTIGERFCTAENEKTVQPMLQDHSLVWENNAVAEKLTEKEKKTYKIVGIMKRPDWEYTWSPGYTALTFINENSISDKETFDVSLIFKKINNKLFGKAKKIAVENGIKDYEFNNNLLRYYGVLKDDQVKSMIYSFSAIMMVIIMAGSISLIYNAFAISVSERSRYLGMLSSVGATKRQKRNSVFFEGAVIGAISIPLGIASGYAGLAITYQFINPLIEGALNVQEGFRLTIYPSSVITSVLVSCITILLSTYLPAKKASAISAIDAIRQITDVKVSKRQVHTSPVTRRLFGIEGDLGLKNLKRNRTRYKATVFSLIISMILFLVVSSFTYYLKRSLVMTQDGINFDIMATVSVKDQIQKEEVIRKMTSLQNYQEKVQMDILEAKTWVEEADIADFLEQGKEKLLQDGKYPYYVSVEVLDDAALEKYAQSIGADMTKLTDPEKPSAIIINQVKFKDKAEDMYVDTKAIKAKQGDQFELTIQNNNTGKIVNFPKIETVALTDKMPMGIASLGKTAGFHMILSEAVFHKLLEGNEGWINDQLQTNVLFNSDNALKLQEELEAIQEETGENNLTIFNVYYYKQQEQQSLQVLSIFTYSFILLITAICIANIINTISTSISLRKREFAMLKSVGITPKGFNKMLNYESMFYGMKALLYGIPLSIAAMYLMYRSLSVKFNFQFTIPVENIIIVIVSVFVIVGTAMLYSSRRVRKENIIDALKQESI